MLSVMTPVNVCLPGGAARTAVASRPKIRNFTLLAAGGHQVRGGGARVHDPDASLAGFVGQSERLRCGARHSDGGVAKSVLLVGAHKVNERRSELRLHPSPILLRGIKSGLNLRLVT